MHYTKYIYRAVCHIITFYVGCHTSIISYTSNSLVLCNDSISYYHPSPIQHFFFLPRFTCATCNIRERESFIVYFFTVTTDVDFCTHNYYSPTSQHRYIERKRNKKLYYICIGSRFDGAKSHVFSLSLSPYLYMVL